MFGLINNHGRRLKAEEEARDEVLVALNQRMSQEHGHSVGRCWVGTGDNVVNVAEAGKAIDIRLVRVCGKRVHEKESTPKISGTHQGASICITTKRA